MSRLSLISKAGMGVIVASALFLSSCSNKITDEQLAQLKELRKQEKSLTEMIEKKKDQKSKLQKELDARKAELKKCEEEKAFVRDKLAKWPDIWPDYTPEPK